MWTTWPRTTANLQLRCMRWGAVQLRYGLYFRCPSSVCFWHLGPFWWTPPVCLLQSSFSRWCHFFQLAGEQRRTVSQENWEQEMKIHSKMEKAHRKAENDLKMIITNLSEMKWAKLGRCSKEVSINCNRIFQGTGPYWLQLCYIIALTALATPEKSLYHKVTGKTQSYHDLFSIKLMTSRSPAQ